MLCLAAPAGAQLRAKKKELGHIQKQLEETRREIEEYRRLEQALGRDVHKLESRNTEIRRRMTDLQRNISAAESKRRELRSRLVAAGRASGFWRSALESEARSYAGGRASRNEAYGTPEVWRESFARAALLEKAQLLAGLRGLTRKTEAAEAQTRRQAAELQTRSRRVHEEQETGRREYEEKKAAVLIAQERKAAALARAKELEETARALTSLLKTLAGARPSGRSRPSSELELPRNSLPWPAQGTVVRPFGRQKNPELDTWVIRQGILLETPAGAAVLAVEKGRVIFAGPFRSYGQVVILDHGSAFYSIYGELGEIMRSKGNAVRAGETIARAGAAAGGLRGTLYLEMRRGTEALDPMAWLKKRQAPGHVTPPN